MAWVWSTLESFEWCNDIADLREKYLVYTGGSCSIDTSVYKTGSRSLKFEAVTAENEFHMPVPLSWYEGALSLHMGFHIYQTGFETRDNGEPIVATFNINGTEQCHVGMNSSGVPVAYRAGTVLATGSSGFSTGTWHWFEVFMVNDNSQGRIKVAIDEVTVIDFSGDTENSIEGMEFIRIEGIDSTTNTQNIDNLFCRVSSSIESDPTFYGECYVRHTVPDADGNHTAWSSTSSPTLYTEVDDLTFDSPETYISSSTDTNKASFSHAALNLDNPGDDVILAVQLDHHATHHVAGNGKIKPFTRISSTDYSGDEAGIAHGGYERSWYIWENSPATASAWTEAEIDGAEFGVEFVS